MGMLERLADEHRALDKLLARLEKCALEGGRGFEDAARECFRSFLKHGRAEEFLYRELLKRIGRSGAISELMGEHQLIMRSSYDLKKAMDEASAHPDKLIGATHVFLQLVKSHMAKEERLIYPEARRLLDKAILDVMERAAEHM